MAQIPLDGPTIASQRIQATPQQDNYAPAGAFDTGAAQIGQIGQEVVGLAADEFKQQRYQKALSDVQARADAASAVVDHQLQVKQLAQDTSERLASGQLSWRDAQDSFKDAASLVDVPTIDGLTGPDAENYQKAIAKNVGTASLQVSKSVYGAQVSQTKGSVDGLLDGLLKLSGQPDVDASKIAGQIDSADQAGSIAYGAAWGKKKQDAKDAAYTNEATQRLVQSHDSLEGLDALQKDLQDGRYANTMDSPKRLGLVEQINVRRGQLQAGIDRAADAADAMGGRAIDEMNKQVATGVPASTDQLSRLSTAVQGTQYQARYAELLKEQSDTQALLRKSPAEQQAEVQRQQATLDRDGGSVEVQAHVKRLADAVSANVKQMQDAPLLYAQARTGNTVQPIDFASLSTPQGAAALASNFQARLATVTGLQNRFGPEIKMAPLLPQEADLLSATIAKSSDAQKINLFGVLSKAMPADAFAGVMQQLKADPPTTAAAMAAGMNLKTSTNNSVAETILSGAALLKDKTVTLPPEKGLDGIGFEQSFDARVGDAVPRGSNTPGETPAREQLLQVTKAVYASLASREGKLGPTLDTGVLQRAIDISTGGVVDTNGGSKVIKPFGMTESDFSDRLDSSLASAKPGGGFTVADLRRAKLQGTATPGVYRLLTGVKFVPDVTGKPLTVSVNNAPTRARAAPVVPDVSIVP